MDNLAAKSDQLGGRDKIDFIVDGLGSDYIPFISWIHSQLYMQFDDFVHLIIKEEMFLRRSSPISPVLGSPTTFEPNQRFICLIQDTLES